jgi:DNA-directed RNA polymerase subunit RPC12/RpoP
VNVTIEKHWDGNECETERNGRIYVSRGRWRWVVVVDGEAESAYDLKRQAKDRAARLNERDLVSKIQGGESVVCPTCGSGRLYLDRAETESTNVLQRPGTMPVVEKTFRTVSVVACNACEYIREVIR